MRATPSEDEMLEFARAWWLIAFLGLVSLVAGCILVAQPSHSLVTLAVVLGIFLLLDGVVELISSLAGAEGNRALAAIIGVLGIVVGIILIRHPTHAVSAIGLVIGIWLVAAGVIRLIRAVVTRERVLLRLAISVLEILVGIAVVSDPHIGYATLAVLVGIWLILNGIGTIAAALAIKGASAALNAFPRTASHGAG